ncbi:hypothetical protein IAD21_04989 [Abditibacteriota bacterium]|nr:hypothetical protein IAD21_04989 [Abditibacteriota bacterium]
MNPNLDVVFHIPKTAGSTLGANFWCNITSKEALHVECLLDDWQTEGVVREVKAQIASRQTEEIRCVFGHWAYWGIHQLVRPQCTPRYITFLREPVERCISLYGYLKTRPENRWYRSLTQDNWSIGEWLQERGELELLNGQTRRLLFDGTTYVGMEHLTLDHLEVAKQRLQQYWFVGLTETFRQDSLYLYGKLNFRRFHHSLIVNATPNKPIVSPEERHALSQANQLDRELYDFARQLRAQWLRDHAIEFRLQQSKARILKAIQKNGSALKRSLRRQKTPRSKKAADG